MELNTKQIEEAGITGLKQYLLKNPYIDSELKSNDKTPAVDGSISLYSKVGFKKKFLKGTINVQLKSTTRNNILKEHRYPVSVNDLKVYYQQSGVIYFVIYINPNNSDEIKIFYKDLLLVDIEEILKSIQGKNQESVTIDFEEIDESVNDFRYVLETFIHNQDIQSKFSLEHKVDAFPKEISLKFVAPNSDTLGYMQKHSIPMYAMKGNLPIPMGRVKPEQLIMISMSEEIVVKVRSTNSPEYRGEKVIINERIMKITLGKYREISIEFDLKTGKMNFKTKLKGDIENYINTLLLAEDLRGQGSLFIDDVEISKSEKNKVNNGTGVLSEEHNALMFFKDMKHVFLENKLPLDIDFFDLSQEEREQIGNLILTYKNPKNSGLTVHEVGDYVVYIMVTENNVFNIFDDPMAKELVFFLEIENKKERVSPYVMLNSADIIRYPYINYENILYSIEILMPIKREIINEIVWLALDFIKAYDLKPNDEFLQCASNILKLVYSNDNEVGINQLINEAQIMKRRKNISREIYLRLLQEAETETTDIFVQISVNLLIDNVEEARKVFETLDEQSKEIYLNMPISYFLNS
ncbi:DUF4365 domain-containing protein [Listeria kieliensis]